MTTPVCPACRASLFLDAYACWRCGLSVRPTCARCGEPLAHGMQACWFCREPITEPEAAQEMAVARVAAASVSRPIAPTPPPPSPTPPASEAVSEPLVPPPLTSGPKPHPAAVPASVVHALHQTVHTEEVPVVVLPASGAGRRVRWGRVVVLGLLGAVLLAAGALAYEATWIRHLPPPVDRIALTRATFPDAGVSLSYPAGWRIEETRRLVTFLSGESAKDRSTRGLRVNSTDIPYSRADEQIEDLRNRLGSYEALETFRREVDGERALVHVFIADDLRFEQWWIDRGKRTLRVDMWSRPADDNARELDRRLVESIELL